MFYVWDINGVKRPYSPGELRAKRNVHAVAPEKALGATIDSEIATDRSLQKKEGYEAYRAVRDMPEHKGIRVGDVMSSPVETLTAEDTVATARYMLRDKRYRHIPVVGENSTVVGILSDRSVLANDTDDSSVLLKDIMRSDVLTAHPETPLREAARIMLEENIGSLPVVDEDEQLIGIVTRSDVLRAVVRFTPLERWI